MAQTKQKRRATDTAEYQRQPRTTAVADMQAPYTWLWHVHTACLPGSVVASPVQDEAHQAPRTLQVEYYPPNGTFSLHYFPYYGKKAQVRHLTEPEGSSGPSHRRQSSLAA